MPKIGQAEDTRPHNTRCTKCGCLVEKVIARFNMYGKGVKHQYRCMNPYHNCGTVERDGCTPERVYEPVAHAYWDGADGYWTHPGRPEDCTTTECVERMTHKAIRSDERHPGPAITCQHDDCEPPF